MVLFKVTSLWIPAVVPAFSRAGAGFFFSLAHGTTDCRVRDSSQTSREPVMGVVTWTILGVQAGLIADMRVAGQRSHGIAGPAIGRSGHRKARR
jgi:hypothetical protein